MHDPPVLLLDEPYQGFDWQTYLAFWDLTGELRDRGTATVVISHLVFEHERFDRVCHLTGGRSGGGASAHAAARWHRPPPPPRRAGPEPGPLGPAERLPPRRVSRDT